jgi:hypothetical protein
MNKPTELLPCPFCGSPEHLFIEPDETGSGGQWLSPIHVGCGRFRGCGVSLCGDDQEEAITRWNTRALTTDTTGDTPDLRENDGSAI